MTKKLLWLDTETTGTNPNKHEIIQLACIVEVDGMVLDKANFRIKPTRMHDIDKEALEVNKITREELETYPLAKDVHKEIVTFLKKHIDPYDRADKFYPGGFNVTFDVRFLRAFFESNNDKFFGSYFNYKYVDVLSLVFLMEFEGMFKLPNNKLKTLCDHFEVKINAHEAMSDIEATRKLYGKLKALVTFKK